VAIPRAHGERRVEVEHPSGFFTVEVEVEPGERIEVRRATLLRTARKLMRGEVFVPGGVGRRS
jgi:4-oxalomesaconate tautomerase